MVAFSKKLLKENFTSRGMEEDTLVSDSFQRSDGADGLLRDIS